ncbi:hypothetical protein BBF96_08585 [Anoxybacter fermentans]|uniref:Uncharacterized protein n=1 Tax=Anoxybacter fermentans TaxID=1323375 RepID=A0A3S9SZ29_9FIRM|nr:hypothetical protein [Anoxybacter fermentans]AZR73432.1 hypothetical protein BBF96_08585 [Anoxybacter fermentans]
MNQVQLEQIYENILSEIEKHNYHIAIEEAAGMIAIARLVDDIKYQLLGKYLMGVSYYHLYDYQKSMEKYMELNNLFLEFSQENGEIDLKAGFFDQVRYGMALNMYHQGDLEGGRIVLTHILEHSEKVDIILNSMILLGVIYLMMYELNRNLKYLVPVLEMYLSLLEEVPLPESKKAMIYNNLAILFIYRGQYEKAQEMLNNSFVLEPGPAELASLFNETARINLERKNFKKGRKILEKADEYLNKTVNLLEEGYHYFLWGILYKEEEKYVKALQTFEKSLFLAKKCNNLMEQIRVYRELADLYEKMTSDSDSEYLIEYKLLKEKVNPVKEVIKWQEVWNAIKDRVILAPTQK